MWFFTICNNIVRFEDWMLKRKRFIPHARASKGEREVEAVLKQHGSRFDAQYELGYCVHVDFAIYHNDRMYLVEYDAGTIGTGTMIHFNKSFTYATPTTKLHSSRWNLSFRTLNTQVHTNDKNLLRLFRKFVVPFTTKTKCNNFNQTKKDEKAVLW